MPRINKPAVRAYRRASGPMYKAQEQAAHMDAQFDGGEFSGPIHADILHREELAIAEAVGSAFGLPAHDLLNMVTEAEYFEHDCVLDFIYRNPNSKAAQQLCDY